MLLQKFSCSSRGLDVLGEGGGGKASKDGVMLTDDQVLRE